jgi:hypothetical protein
LSVKGELSLNFKEDVRVVARLNVATTRVKCLSYIKEQFKFPTICWVKEAIESYKKVLIIA